MLKTVREIKLNKAFPPFGRNSNRLYKKAQGVQKSLASNDD